MDKLNTIRQAGQTIASQSRIAAISLGAAIELTPQDTEAVAIGAALPPVADGAAWAAGMNLAEGTIVTYGGGNYLVVQGHIAQAAWTPAAVPALFKALAEPCAEWSHPQGAHDAYMIGDRVTYQGKTWESTVNANVYAPGVVAGQWSEVT